MIQLPPARPAPHPFRQSLRLPYRPWWQQAAEQVSTILVAIALGLASVAFGTGFAHLGGWL